MPEVDFAKNEEILVPDTLDSVTRQHKNDKLCQPGIEPPITTNNAEHFSVEWCISLMMIFFAPLDYMIYI